MEQPLLKGVLKGEQSSVRTFVQAELPKVYSLCARLCLTTEDAEDLAQDVFIKALQALPNFKGESSVSTWLYRITLNTWKNKVRSEKSRKRLSHVSLSSPTDDENEEGKQPLAKLAESHRSVEEDVEHQDLRTNVMATLHELEKEEKEILILKDIEDRSYEEIAEVLSLNLGTVKSRLSRARESLRIRLMKKGFITSS